MAHEEKCYRCGRFFDADLMSRCSVTTGAVIDPDGQESYQTGVVDLCPNCAGRRLRRLTFDSVAAVVVVVAMVALLALLYVLSGGR